MVEDEEEEEEGRCWTGAGGKLGARIMLVANDIFVVHGPKEAATIQSGGWSRVESWDELGGLSIDRGLS